MSHSCGTDAGTGSVKIVALLNTIVQLLHLKWLGPGRTECRRLIR